MIVGNDHYSKVTSLNCCINDADSIATILSRHSDDSPDFDVELLKDVTADELRANCKKLFDSDPEIALFYYSGHGYSVSGQGYLVTVECDVDNRGVDMNDILELAIKSKAKNKVIIIDACHSGLMGSSPLDTNISRLPDGMTVITSSRSGELSLECGKHGIFTELLIEALDGGASDLFGNVTAGSIYAYIDRSLGPWDQRPVFKTNVSSFVVIRNTEPHMDVGTLREIQYLFKDANSEYALDPSFEFTNSPGYTVGLKEPYADEKNVRIFKIMQKLASVNLVRPKGEDHLYFAAMNSKSCELTSYGKYIYRLLKEGKI